MMFDFSNARIFLRPGTTNMRSGKEELLHVINDLMKQDPFSGAVFMFCNGQYFLGERPGQTFVDGIQNPTRVISVISWDKLTARKLQYMIDSAYNDRASCDYDLSRPMRRRNS